MEQGVWNEQFEANDHQKCIRRKTVQYCLPTLSNPLLKVHIFRKQVLKILSLAH